LAVTTAGCAGQQHLALGDDAAQRIKTVKLISIIPQAAVVPTVVPSGGAKTAESIGMMFGAIGGAIGGSISGNIQAGQIREAEAKLAALIEPQKRISLRQEFLDRLRQAADGSNRFVIQEAETVIKGDGEPERDRALKELPQDGVLTVLTRYYLSPDFRVFTVTSKAELWQKAGGERVFLGEWQYHSTPRSGDSEAEVIGAWATDDGEALVTVAHEAIDKIALMMKIDLLGEAGDPGDLGTTTVSYTGQARGEPISVEGRILERQSGWAVMRSGDGALHTAYAP
jgi:hypothetical protein